MNRDETKSDGGNPNTPKPKSVLKIKDFEGVEEINMDCINTNRIVYDVLTKSFVPYDEYMAGYKKKMYGLKTSIDEDKSKPQDDIDYFD